MHIHGDVAFLLWDVCQNILFLAPEFYSCRYLLDFTQK